jgi:hypothetical protein
MWVLYVVWAFSAPLESRTGSYALKSQCEEERVVIARDSRVKKATCVWRTDSWQSSII